MLRRTSPILRSSSQRHFLRKLGSGRSEHLKATTTTGSRSQTNFPAVHLRISSYQQLRQLHHHHHHHHNPRHSLLNQDQQQPRVYRRHLHLLRPDQTATTATCAADKKTTPHSQSASSFAESDNRIESSRGSAADSVFRISPVPARGFISEVAVRYCLLSFGGALINPSF